MRTCCTVRLLSNVPRSFLHVVAHDGTLAERTLVLLKPDAVERRLVGSILSRFEAKGLALVGMRMVLPDRKLAEAHMAVHRDRDFFERACRFLCSGSIVCVALEGRGAIQATRSMIGESSDPLGCSRGTIRGDLASHWRRNLVHGSDSVESARRELELWFPDDTMIHSAPSSMSPWLYELPDAKITFDDDN